MDDIPPPPPQPTILLRTRCTQGFLVITDSEIIIQQGIATLGGII